jgi:hypothetical protein
MKDNQCMATLLRGLLAAMSRHETIEYAHVWDLFVAVGGRQDEILDSHDRWAGVSLRCHDGSVLDVRVHAGRVVSIRTR